MRWKERMKRALGTFKRMLFPLYAWYFILAILGIVLTFISLIPAVFPMVQHGELGPRFPQLPGFPEVPGTSSLLPSPFSGLYPNPNPPVPPGQTFTTGESEIFTNNLSLISSYLPAFLLTFVGLILVSWLLSSVFMTGMFHLTKKAYTSSSATFRDFRVKGFSRILGWYGILTVLGILVVGLGGFIAFSLRNIDYAIPFFAGLYVLFLVALGIFLAPWLSTAGFYMLNHPERSFKESFKESWHLYIHHKGSFWSLILTLIGLQLLIVFLDQYSTDLGLLASVIISPFSTILPIVWVLTHEEEQNYTKPLFSYPSTPVTASVATPVTAPVSLNPYSQPPSPPGDKPSALEPDVSPSPNQTHSNTEAVARQETRFKTPEVFKKSSLFDSTPEPKDYPPIYTPKIASEGSSITICPTCGQNIRPGAGYCSQCGTKL